MFQCVRFAQPLRTEWCATIILLLLATTLPVAKAQDAAQQYNAAKSILKTHTSEDGILNDDSPEARAALSRMWDAAGEAVAEIVGAQPTLTPKQIDEQLCKQGIAAGGCIDASSPQQDVLQLGKGLYGVAVVTDTGSTVRIIGDRDGKAAQLWSLDQARVANRQDPRDLVGAWRPDRTGIACRDKNSADKPGSCGPLSLELGLLPPDDQGRPRFYIDASYEQLMGATIGKQTSLWRWDGDHAELLWIELYSFMAAQTPGTAMDEEKSTLHLGQKGDFKTMFSCGSCIDRPLDRSILLTGTGLIDLGTRSLVPELDRIDDLFSLLQRSRPTTGIASPQVSGFLRKGIANARQTSSKIDPTWFSVGMIGSSTVKLTPTGADVCLSTDNTDFGSLRFAMKSTADGGYFIQHVASLPENADCLRGSSLPLPRPTSALTPRR